MSVQFTDRSDEVKDDMEGAVLRALEKCGLTAEKYAKKLCKPDTGLLRNSITHAISGEKTAISRYKASRGDKTGEYSGTVGSEEDEAVYIGTNVEYAPYVEFGTGKYVAGGRPTPWVYKDEKGKWHKTDGREPRPFIKPAVADHIQTYKKIIKDELHGD